VAEVKVQDGESIESALRRFKRKVQQEDIIKDIKKHSFYLKRVTSAGPSRRWRASGAGRSSAGKRNNWGQSPRRPAASRGLPAGR